MACLFHKWDGCKCSKCGKIRDEQHNFIQLEGQCKQKCSVCDKVIIKHGNFSPVPENCLEKCDVCGETRQGNHEWECDFYYEHDRTTESAGYRKCARCKVLITFGFAEYVARKAYNDIVIEKYAPEEKREEMKQEAKGLTLEEIGEKAKKILPPDMPWGY
ncbi:MAG: hypothetical protein FWG70_10365 [Oscillospiraceae bacterium]|nr:hypothetical protein [Oscillospiraceae bacterium]